VLSNYRLELTARPTSTSYEPSYVRTAAQTDRQAVMRRQTTRAVALAAMISAVIWASSAWITGHQEPWDAEGLFYVTSLALCGVISGALIPRPLWAHYVGSVLGQVLYQLIFLPIGPLFVLGLGFLLGYALLFLLGALVGSRVRRHLNARTSAT